MERIIGPILDFCKKKQVLRTAGVMIDNASDIKLVGFKDGAERGKPLGIRGFKGEEGSMWRGAIRDGLKIYDSVWLTTFDGDNRVTGSLEIFRERVRG